MLFIVLVLLIYFNYVYLGYFNICFTFQLKYPNICKNLKFIAFKVYFWYAIILSFYQCINGNRILLFSARYIIQKQWLSWKTYLQPYRVIHTARWQWQNRRHDIMTLCIHIEVVAFLAESSHGHLVLQKTVLYVDEAARWPISPEPSWQRRVILDSPGFLSPFLAFQ